MLPLKNVNRTNLVTCMIIINGLIRVRGTCCHWQCLPVPVEQARVIFLLLLLPLRSLASFRFMILLMPWASTTSYFEVFTVSTNVSLVMWCPIDV